MLTIRRLKAAQVTSHLSAPTNGTKFAETITKKVSFQYLPKFFVANQILVERRRRETINEGINELAKIVPGCEKNKGSILQRAVQFITQLKENEQQNIEKWTLEKLLTEQAITELSASCDKFKAECQRAWDECQIYKRACENNGILPDEIKERQENGEHSGPNPIS